MNSLILTFLTITTSFAFAQTRQDGEAKAVPTKADIIKRFDKDGDGKLSAEEGAEARRALGAREAAKPADAEKPREYKARIAVIDPKGFKVEGGKAIFSGPQSGERLPKLNVLEFDGQSVGKTFNALGANKGAQLIILSDHNRSSIRGLIGLSRLVATINQKSNDKLNAVIVYLGEDRNQLSEHAGRYHQYLAGKPVIGLSNDGRDGPGSYGLNRNVSMTIIIAKDGRVLYNFPFPEGMLTPDPHVLGGISEVLDAEHDKMTEWLAASSPQRSNATRTRANTGGIDIRALLAPVLNKEASDEEIDAAAKRVDAVFESNKTAAQQIGTTAKRLVESGNLSNYGTKRSQYHLFKWAKLHEGAASRPSPPSKDK
ncbi:MAG: hypothetical protein CMJ76_10735 [Planctomycetaceae bacterium]|nr:hypothetical protein [Planctomycetaceae bacterium]